jgi:hypothetical protein
MEMDVISAGLGDVPNPVTLLIVHLPQVAATEMEFDGTVKVVGAHAPDNWTSEVAKALLPKQTMLSKTKNELPKKRFI